MPNLTHKKNTGTWNNDLTHGDAEYAIIKNDTIITKFIGKFINGIATTGSLYDTIQNITQQASQSNNYNTTLKQSLLTALTHHNNYAITHVTFDTQTPMLNTQLQNIQKNSTNAPLWYAHPSTWHPHIPRLVELNHDSYEYFIIANLLVDALPNAQHTNIQIHRVQNSWLYRKFAVHRECMKVM